ncbi:MAG: hypothetical protein J6K86_03650 [Clostridia bacterium]|nr:hypothetical protein [Clostridia bacterium]MBP3422841.1 hypothetical protein [Clostridia bacterium]
MRKSLKRILTAALSALAFVAAGFGVSALKTVDVAKAEGELAITARTLNVSNNVNVVFMIKTSVGDAEKVKVVAKEVNAVDGTEEAPVILSATGTYTDESTGTVYDQYIYKGVEAKEMPNVVYAYAYHVDNPTVLSATRKFSIIEYAHTSLASGADSKLEALIKATLDYGEAAAAFEDQNLPADYLNDYKLWELDESTNATFADGFDYSYVYEGQKVAIKPATNYIPAAGVDYLENNGDGTYTYTVPAELPNFENVFVDNSDNISDADKAQTVLDAITVDTTAVAIGDTLTLNTTPVNFEDEATISWEVSGATLDGNVVTFDTKGTATLTATVTCGEASASDIWTITVMPKVLATFEFGANGDAVHKDGSTAKTTYTETDGEYTLSLEAGAKMYPESYDAKGNSCIKLGSGSAAGKFTFTVPNEVVEVIILVAGYKDNKAKIAINDAPAVEINKLSDNGEYTQIIVDTSSDKTVELTTASGGWRAMLNTIIFRSVELTAQEKVDTEVETLSSLELSAVEVTEEVQLPMAQMYDDVTVMWSMDDSEFATLNGETGVLTVNTLPTEEDVILTLTVIVSAEGATSKTENTTIVLKKVVVPDPDPTPDPEEPGEGGDEVTEKTYSYTFTAKQFSANGTQTLGDVAWTVAGDGGYWGYDGTKGQQLGSGGSPYESLTLTSGNFSNVSKIVINTSGASSINATLTVTVGGTQVGSSTKLTSAATDYTFTVDNGGVLTGAVVFTFTQTTSKAIYIKSIEITYVE